MRTLKEIVVGLWVAVLTTVYILFLFISIILFIPFVFFKKILTRS